MKAETPAWRDLSDAMAQGLVTGCDSGKLVDLGKRLIREGPLADDIPEPDLLSTLEATLNERSLFQTGPR